MEVVLEYRVLGKLEASRSGTRVDLGAFKQRSLLALLLMNVNNIVSTDRILEELWGDDATPDRQNTLWVYISNLRKALDPDREKRSEGAVLLTRSPGYVLQADPSDIDATQFERMVEEGRSLLGVDPAAASLVLSQALALWRGHAYEDFTYELFAGVEIGRLEEQRLVAVQARVEADLQRGLSRELVSELESLVRQHPLREELTGQLMLALYRSGRQVEALRAFQLLGLRLGEELGIEPSGPIRKLEDQIVTGDPGLDVSLGGGMSDQTGMAIRGYELRETIGEGAYGVAYRAYQPAVGREVAIKAIHSELANSPAFIRRFEAEAQLVARLEHPHIVPLYDYWREPDAAYLVMRLVRGGTLQDVIDSSAMAVDQATKLVEQIGSALAMSHQNGVIHRAIKPANILFDEEGNSYLSDFGIALGEAEAAGDQHVKAATLAAPFASPEQLTRSPVTAASDIYSFGVVVAQALAGMTGDVLEILGALSPELARVVERATAGDPATRYHDVRQFVGDFLDAADVGRRSDILKVATEDARNPYKGLCAFQQADAADFYGRQQLVERLLDRLGKMGARSRFVALVGPSGSGKSSAVKAGLLPALSEGALPLSDEWFQIEMTPAPHPFEELEAALLNVAVDPPASLLEQLSAGEGGLRRAARRILPEEGSQLFIVIDQLEELFTQVADDVADRFLDAIVAAVTDDRSRVRVVATLRADFYDRPLRHRAFGELLRGGTEVITPMAPDELERAICGPAEAVGVRCAPDLVATLISDVADRPGALPLLQYTVTELFDCRESAELSLDAYDDLGGVSGALAECAERLFGDLNDTGRACARQVLLALVTLGEGTADTRRRVLLSELEQLPVRRPDLKVVLEIFGQHRLFSFDRDPVTRSPTVEISHEALLTEWQRLDAWVDDAREDVRYQRALRGSAEEWLAARGEPGFLLSAGRFARYEDWQRTTTLPLGALEAEYLEASSAALSARQAEEEAQAKREIQLEQKAKHRLAGVAVVLAIGVVVAGILSLFALQQSREAERQRDEATAQRAVAIEQGQEAERQAAEAERQRGALEESLALRVAEQLPDRVLGLRSRDSQLALLLAGEAVVAAHASGASLIEAVAALQLSLQSAGASFPADSSEVAVVSSPEGSRGIFVLDVGSLLDIRDLHIARELSNAECLEYLARACAPMSVRDRLPEEVLASAEASPSRALKPLSGTNIALGVATRPRPPRATTEMSQAAWGRSTQFFEDTFEVDVAVDVDAVDSQFTLRDRFLRPPDVVAQPFRSPLLDVVPIDEIVDMADVLANVPVTMNGLLFEDGAQQGLWTWYDMYSGVWFRPDVFDDGGVDAPETWDELVEVTERIAAAGYVPWCVGVLGSDAALPVMVMVQSQIVDVGGLELLDQWTQHAIAADDPRIVEAHQRVGALLFDERFNGGTRGVAVRGANSSSAFLAADDPCAMWLAPASWAQRAHRLVLQAPHVDVFALPTSTASSPVVIVSGTQTFLIEDRPETRALMRQLTWVDFGAQAAAAAVTTDIAANMRLNPIGYSDPLSRTLARALQDAAANDAMRVDIFDLVPRLADVYADAVRRWSGEGNGALESILADVELAWQAIDSRS